MILMCVANCVKLKCKTFKLPRSTFTRLVKYKFKKVSV